MYNALTRPHIALIRKALTEVGADFPKPVQKALAEQDKIRTAAREYAPASTDQILAAVAECLLNDRDPADDEQVRRMVTSHALAGPGGLDLTAQAEGRVVSALTAHADDILAILAPHAEEAGKQLATAYELLGDETDPTVIMSRGVLAVEAWGHVQRAQALLNTIDRAWTALASVAGFGSSAEPALRLGDLDLDVLEKAGRRADAWEIVRAGGCISLADRTTFRERVRSIEQQRQDRATAAASAPHEAWGRQLSHGARA